MEAYHSPDSGSASYKYARTVSVDWYEQKGNIKVNVVSINIQHQKFVLGTVAKALPVEV